MWLYIHVMYERCTVQENMVFARFDSLVLQLKHVCNIKFATCTQSKVVEVM